MRAGSDVPEPSPVVEADGLGKRYRRGADVVAALSDVTLRFEDGGFYGVVGPSGAGKTTLLNLLGAMDLPSSGTLRVAGQDIAAGGRAVISESGRDRLRRRRIGFVFTEFFLIPTLTALENVSLPLLWNGRSDRARAVALLERVGLGSRLSHRPGEMSGGEMQRVAIARSLVNEPRLLLADEPTGNLDTRTRDSIFALFQELNADGLTVVLATHDRELADRIGAVVHLEDGRVAATSGRAVGAATSGVA
jgi:putative ABC transport system ATP-binding protein